jgi:hypothetical protein
VIPLSVGVVSFVSGLGAGYGFKTVRDRKIEAGKSTFEGSTSRVDDSNVDHEDGGNEAVIAQLRFENAENLRAFNHAMQQAAHIVRELKESGAIFLADGQAAKVIPDVRESREVHPSNDRGGKIIVDEEALSQAGNVVNIFPADDDDDDWDYEVEVPLRTPDKPYIIHRDEYFDQERDCSQSSLMYYAGDHILCDDHDTPVYDPEKVVGLVRFGHGSKDPNVCYVRNETLDAEYEILQDPGYYQIEVLGEALAEKDLKHSKVIPKFRME